MKLAALTEESTASCGADGVTSLLPLCELLQTNKNTSAAHISSSILFNKEFTTNFQGKGRYGSFH